jgi:flagellin
MALTINTNLTALNAQRNLNNTQSTLNKSMQRLSTGLRINSAKDDAAGLAISNRMDSQIRGMNQAARNANDAISLAQTAEGAMNEVTSLLQRMREISVQASNATYSDSDRASLQNEMDQFFEEIDRIADSTTFNGINLLDGSSGTRTIQVGAQSGETVSMTLGSIKTGALHLNGYSAAGELNSGRVGAVSTAGGGLTINGVDVAAAGGDTAEDAATAINDQTSLTGVSATAYNIVEGNGNVSGITSGLTIDTGNGANTIADSGSIEELVDNINRDAAGVTATLNSEGGVTLTNDTGAIITIGGTVKNSGFTVDDYDGYLALTDDNNEAIEITETSGGDLGLWGFNPSTGSGSVTGGTVTSAELAAGDLLINGVDVGDVTGKSAGDKAAGINAISDQTGVTASAETSQAFDLDFGATITADGLTINGTEVDLTVGTIGTLNLENVVSAINNTVQGVVASANEDGELVLKSSSGLDIVVAGANTGVLGTNEAGAAAAGTYSGQITLESSNGGDIVITGGTSAGIAKAGFVEQGGADAAIGSGLSVGTVANANVAIERIDDALNNIASQRGNLGAIQNRLDSTISNLGSVAENLTAANSRILDADFASETAAMTKAQIMTQAGTAMLAQANQLPQTVLSLLQ